MKILLSFIEWKKEYFEYPSIGEFEAMLADNDIDGIELVSCWEEEYIPKDLIKGIHLPSLHSWMDYYLGHESRVIEEYGSMKVAKDLYRYEPDQLYKYYLKPLERAEEAGAYTVFHLSNCNLREYLSRDHYYTDEKVIDTSAEFINTILQNSNYSGLFLMENLYLPGMNLTDPDQIPRLMDQIEYDNKGIILDTGHLMNTNLDIRSEDEGWDHVEEVLEKNKDHLHHIKAIHLHQSVSGTVAKHLEKTPPKLGDDYREILETVYKYVGKIDTHSLVTSKKARRIIEMINPEYLVLEFRYHGRKDLERKLRKQMEVLRR